MFAVYVFLLCWCHRSSADEAELAPPRDVNMVTLNTHYSLNWVWDQSAAEANTVNFTTEYLSKYRLKRKSPTWSTACEATSARSCDLTQFNLHYLAIYMIRVRASVNGRHSSWVSVEFCPDKDARVGPPSKVELTPDESAFQVSISDPLTSINTSMREHLPDLYYHILYWERSVEGQALPQHMLSKKVNVVNVLDLKAWTRYCVSVQTRYDFYNKSSCFSPPVCVQTEGAVRWWQITGYFLGALMVCFLVVLSSTYGSFWCFKTCKDMFFPKMSSGLKEYLFDPLGSDFPHLISDSEPELLCVNVTICPKPDVLETYSLPARDFPAAQSGLESDSSGRHSRQDSSTSGDSGVYSAGGNSSAPPDTSQSFTATDGSWKRSFSPERVKMQEMEPKLCSGPAVMDEGVLDLCV
ncbi:interferon alpha/beta receptor 1b-like [Melanotaenia boesemani]|uniref:interferon alpha/beta receptor 1b-like n=1 Tax=Melanotaenia boesemani TaxID=1250792 RepID=UPI001C05A2DD|nr:interferon alpha/beta receptor 1b-like [Melanotaenia boesemani]